MDRITKSLFHEFIEEHSLQNYDESVGFELFTCYLIVTNHYNETFALDSVFVGEGEIGIDGIAILVNGVIVDNPEEVDDLLATNGYIDATIIFIQAERSNSFDMAKAGQFAYAVQDFFSERPQLPQNQTIQLKRQIVERILGYSSKFRKGNPQCYLYYITSGIWRDDQNLLARKYSAESDLNSMALFRKVRFYYLGADEIQRLYREAQNAISTEIVFPNRVALPELEGVEQSYLGLLPVFEFRKLIENSNQEVLTNVFHDNVRHWQEWNQVNTEIHETLSDETKQIYFPLMNNGITIVAKSLISTGNKLVIEDYQIVNGCQTSFVIHELGEQLNQNLLIPLRLIATQDTDIRNSIIKATNRQTEVTDAQLFALSEFPRKLEEYFPTFEGHKKLYYERRSRQYSAISGIEKVRIISMTTLVRSFASMFLEKPHRTTRNYKSLISTLGTDIFHPDHRLEMYYVSGYAHYRLDYLFRSQVLESQLKPARYHLLLCFRLLAAQNPYLPRFNSKDMKKYCEHFMDILWNEDEYKNIFERSAEYIRSVANGNYHRDNIRTESFTSELLTRLGYYT